MQKEKQKMPSLILIDGGVGQLHAAAQALEERAASILTWPISDQLMGILIFIVAGVSSGVIVRLAFLAAKL